MFRKLTMVAVVTAVAAATLVGGTASAQAATVSSPYGCKGTAVTRSVSDCGATPQSVRWQ